MLKPLVVISPHCQFIQLNSIDRLVSKLVGTWFLFCLCCSLFCFLFFKVFFKQGSVEFKQQGGERNWNPGPPSPRASTLATGHRPPWLRTLLLHLFALAPIELAGQIMFTVFYAIQEFI